MDQVVIGLLGFAAIGAAWDAARRYFDVRRFNQTVLDNQARIEVEHQNLKERVGDLSSKLALNLGGLGGNRQNRVGSIR